MQLPSKTPVLIRNFQNWGALYVSTIFAYQLFYMYQLYAYKFYIILYMC